MLFMLKVLLKTVGAFVCNTDFYIPPTGWLWTKLYILILTKPVFNQTCVVVCNARHTETIMLVMIMLSIIESMFISLINKIIFVYFNFGFVLKITIQEALYNNERLQVWQIPCRGTICNS